MVIDGWTWEQLYSAAFPPPEPVIRASGLPVVAPAPPLTSGSVMPSEHEGVMGKVIDLVPRDPRKCTAHKASTGEPCPAWAIKGGKVCRGHGGAAPNVADAAARRVQEQSARALATKMVGEVELARYADPFEALQFAVSYSYAFADRMARVVEAIPDDKLRYEGKLGEHLRGEVVAMQRALSDLRLAAEGSLKLGLAERRQRLEESQIEQLARALEMALTASGLDLPGLDKARHILQRELEKLNAG